MGGTMERMREWGTPAIAIVAFLALLGIVGRMEMDAMTPNGCIVIGEEPSGPEPDVTIWHRHMDCGGTIHIVEFHNDEFAGCGFVMDSESVGMVPASCATESDLHRFMDSIRSERSGFRAWEDGR
jgi:hypothetical protein